MLVTTIEQGIEQYFRERPLMYLYPQVTRKTRLMTDPIDEGTSFEQPTTTKVEPQESKILRPEFELHSHCGRNPDLTLESNCLFWRTLDGLGTSLSPSSHR